MALSAEKVKDKTKDKGKEEKDFKFKKIKHTHEDSPVCYRCDFEEREKEAKNKIQKMKDTDTTTLHHKGGPDTTHILKSITIVRGKYDDVVGYQVEWQ